MGAQMMGGAAPARWNLPPSPAPAPASCPCRAAPLGRQSCGMPAWHLPDPALHGTATVPLGHMRRAQSHAGKSPHPLSVPGGRPTAVLTDAPAAFSRSMEEEPEMEEEEEDVPEDDAGEDGGMMESEVIEDASGGMTAEGRKRQKRQTMPYMTKYERARILGSVTPAPTPLFAAFVLAALLLRLLLLVLLLRSTCPRLARTCSVCKLPRRKTERVCTI